MTTVRELIDYLKTLPEDTEVEVIVGHYSDYSYCTETVPLNLDPYTGNVDFTDFSGNEFVKEGSKFFNKKYLTLGEK